MTPADTTLVGKIALVTGANAGIGREVARGLAARGATVVMWCRSFARAEEARADIVATTGNDAVHVVLGDLSLQRDVRRGAAELLARFPRLDVLVNNAGLVLAKRVETDEGVEAMLATNHLGPFLLTELLRERLVASAPARVVNVTSILHWLGRVRFDDLQSRRRYNGYLVYAHTKLMNVLFTRELARRLAGSGVVVNAVHPGNVATSIGPERGAFRLAAHLVRPMLLTPAQGADTIVWLASAPEGAAVSGRLFIRRAARPVSIAARDEAVARRLWDASARLVGLGVTDDTRGA